MEWQLAGNIGVDAGICWIGDPCYVFHQEEPPKAIGKDWGDFCNTLHRNNNDYSKNRFQSFTYDLGHEGLGVLVSTGYGDGTYPVYIRKNEEGRVIEARIVFSSELLSDAERQNLGLEEEEDYDDQSED